MLMPRQKDYFKYSSVENIKKYLMNSLGVYIYINIYISFPLDFKL